MNNWKDTLINPNASIYDAIAIIDKGSLQIAVVVDNNNKLLGTITDGDVRRGLLKGIKLSDKINSIVNTNPITLPLGSPTQQRYAI